MTSVLSESETIDPGLLDLILSQIVEPQRVIFTSMQKFHSLLLMLWYLEPTFGGRRIGFECH